MIQSEFGKQCTGRNKSQNIRCSVKLQNNVTHCKMSSHDTQSFINPTFENIKEEIIRSKCAIGLLSDNDLYLKYKKILEWILL